MGYPFDQATWNVLTDVMYIGAGGSAPGLYTLIGLAICAVTLFYGNAAEKKRYEAYK